jgi:hypothetical protein
VEGSCEHNNDAFGSVKCCELFKLVATGVFSRINILNFKGVGCILLRYNIKY